MSGRNIVLENKYHFGIFVLNCHDQQMCAFSEFWKRTCSFHPVDIPVIASVGEVTKILAHPQTII